MFKKFGDAVEANVEKMMKEKLLAILERKQEERTAQMSEEEIRKRIAELEV